MNQILSTSMPMDKKKKRDNYVSNGPVDIKSILKVLAIIMIIFAILIIGNGTFSVINNQKQVKEDSLEPSISLENKENNIALLKIVHQRVISKVEYSWNDGQVTTINGNNGQYLEKEIRIPSGKNTLNILVQDEKGKQITYNKEYELESKINIDASINKIKITYSNNVQIAYMTYKWDDGEEKTITINDTKIDKEIEPMKGLHQLTVTVVDDDNNIDTKIQKIDGVSKPKLEIDFDDDIKHFVIRTSDEEQLYRIEFKLNQDDNQNYVLNLKDMDLKELEYTLPMELQEGENILEVTVYNKKGLTEYSGVRFFKSE